MRRKRLIRPTFGSSCRPDKTQQRRIRHWLPDAAQAPYPAQVLLLPPDFHLGTEGPLVAVANNYDKFNYTNPPSDSKLPRVRTRVREYVQNDVP